MESVGQPREQSRFRARKVDAGHADLGESQLACPLADPGKQERTVDLTAVESHPSIVGSASRQVRWAGEDDTRAFAERLAAQPALADAFVELRGELGAGKTTFVRHLLRALGVTGRIKSPTYAVAEPYEVDGRAIWHFDFYRFDDPREWEDAGFRDTFAAPGLKLAEWPDKAGGLLPVPDLVLRLAVVADDSREVTLKAPTARGRELLACA